MRFFNHLGTLRMNINEINVTKRDGRTEPFNIDKIHQVCQWAAEGLDDVSISQVELNAQIQFYDGIPTDTIHSTLIKSAADLISTDTPGYQCMAARLVSFNLRKEAYGTYTPPKFYDHINRLVEKGNYDPAILTDYTKEEIDELDKCIDHTRDEQFAYAGMKQLEGKYLVQNRVTKKVYETPQFAYMLIGMCLFSSYSKDERMNYVKKFYDAVSLMKISLPTPIMAGVRTRVRQFSSCVLIECGDSLDSIKATSSAIVDYISRKAGIGINAGRIRAIDSEVKGGEVRHTGCIPFYKMFQAAVKSCSQGSVRSGASTVFYPIWHLEVESLLVLKNNRGIEENRARHMDYGVQINGYIYRRLIRGEDITLFSPHQVTDLYDAFFEDQEKFAELYEKYEKDETITKSKIPARDLFTTLSLERSSTGRIYIQNVDHCNTNSPFDPKKAPVRQSNLCVIGDTEITVDRGDGPIKTTIRSVVESGWDGLKVLGHSINDSQNMYGRITAGALTKTDADVLRIDVKASGDVLHCTPEHKIFTYNRGYVEAQHLTEEDLVLLVDGRVSTTIKTAVTDKYDVYDITVEEIHNFFANDVLIHNCLEIALPTKPVSQTDHSQGEIALCTLSAVNMGRVESDEDLENTCDLIVRALDALLDYQEYPLEEAERASKQRRTLGVGVINYAYWLAKQGVGYSYGKSPELTHTFFEKFQYYLLKSSATLAKEFGKCPAFDETTYAKGILPIDRYNKRVDDLTPNNLTMDWEWLRSYILAHGLRNSTLSALMPSECQSKDNVMLLADGTKKTLGDLLKDCGIDVESIESLGIPTRENIRPFNLAGNREVVSVYYNGMQPVIGLKFEDGSYFKFTSNHKLQVAGKWTEVSDVRVGYLIDTTDGVKKVTQVDSLEAEHTWDVSTPDEQYVLGNGCISHNTSAIVSNSTNGIEPPRGLITVKESKEGALKQVVPEIEKLAYNYETAWDMPNNTGYLTLACIMQKFVDQAISANTYYDPLKFPNGKTPVQAILNDLLFAYRHGLKTLYYHNTRDHSGAEIEDDTSCAGGACKI